MALKPIVAGGFYNSSSGGSPGGSNTQLQYNNSGGFGGISGWSTNGSTGLTGAAGTTLAVAGATIGSNGFATAGPSLMGELVKFGGETSAFPALKRSSAALQCRLADDSAFANFQAVAVRVESSGSIFWNGSTILQAPSDGLLVLFNAAGTSFGRLQFGGTSNLFPALERASAVLRCRLADNSDYAIFDSKGYWANGNAGVTVGPFTNITSITVEGGIVTDLQGS